MNRSYSKIRHIQEANQRLEKRVMSEQFSGEIKREMPSYETPVKRNEPRYKALANMDDPNDYDAETSQRNSVRSQLGDIIDNFESINCDGISAVSAEELWTERPEYEIIYCTSYRGKSKEDMIDLLNNNNINEQTSKDVGCLLSAGYKKETIGGPMVRREVYTTKKNGLTYYFDIRGGVRVFNRTTNKTGKWVCESKKIKLVDMKETPPTLD